MTVLADPGQEPPASSRSIRRGHSSTRPTRAATPSWPSGWTRERARSPPPARSCRWAARAASSSG